MKYLDGYYLSFAITVSIINLYQPVLLTFLVHLLNPSVNKNWAFSHFVTLTKRSLLQNCYSNHGRKKAYLLAFTFENN